MAANGDRRNLELVGDLLRGQPIAEPRHHVCLAPGQLQLDPVDGCLLLSAGPQLLDQCRDTGSRDDRVSAQGDLDSPCESGGAESLGDEPFRARADRRKQLHMVELRRDDEHRGIGRSTGDAIDGLDAASRYL